MSKDNNHNHNKNNDLLTNVKYICKSSSLMIDALQRGLDVTQFADGDIIITEVKTVHTHFSYDQTKDKMVRIGNNNNKV